jgi:hypothetical protein
MKKKIGALLLSVVMAVALLAGPALARDRDDADHDRWRGGHEWRENHPYQGYAYRPQPRWNYAESRYRYRDYGWRWPWEDHDGWRDHRGGWGDRNHDRD